MNRCPGYGRPCGVMTPRPLCYFCVRSAELARTLSGTGVSGFPTRRAGRSLAYSELERPAPKASE